MSLERAARREPALYAFGTRPLRRLTREEEPGAPFEDRLISVWAYLVKRAKRFTATLGERERAHLGTDDLLGAIVLRLLEKEAKWDPARGRYVTFCEKVIQNVIVAERERARVVRAPSNARSRLETYRAMGRAGTLKPGQRETMRAIEAALGETEEVHHHPAPVTDRDETPRAAAADEARDRDFGDVVAALRAVENPIEALILARVWGLLGSAEQTPAEIAAALGTDARKVRVVQARAESSLGARIRKLRDGGSP